MVSVLNSAFRDTLGRLVVSGGRYAVGRGTRVKQTEQMVVHEQDDGSWTGNLRHGGSVVQLGVPGQQDDAGEQALLAFVPLDDSWEPIEEAADMSRADRLAKLIEDLDQRRLEREAAINHDIDMLLAEFPEASADDKDHLSSFVMNGDGRYRLQQLIAIYSAGE